MFALSEKLPQLTLTAFLLKFVLHFLLKLCHVGAYHNHPNSGLYCISVE